MLNNESRFLISDSIKNDVESLEEEKPKVDESQIAILMLLEKNANDNGMLGILRGVEAHDFNLKLSFTTNTIDALKILMQFQVDQRKQFESAVIDFQGQINKIDLIDKKIISFLVKEIDSEKQTSNCEIIFHKE